MFRTMRRPHREIAPTTQIPRARALPCLVSLWFLAVLGRAQCQPAWGQGAPPSALAVVGQIRAMLEWDPDGAGPSRPVLAIGGDLESAAGQPAENLMFLDPVSHTWSSAGASFDGAVTALAIAADGDLIAGGAFSRVGNLSALGIARFDAGGWSALGGGVTGTVLAVAGMPNGDVVVGGQLTQAGSVAVNHIAAFDGTQWSPMQGGVVGAPTPGLTGVAALSIDRQGLLIVAGLFSHAGGVASDCVALWSGAHWKGLPSLGPWTALDVRAATATANGLLIAGRGLFGGEQVRFFDGQTWSNLGTPFGTIVSVLELADGSWVTASSQSVFGNGIARWSGTAWTLLTATPLLTTTRIAAVPSLGASALAAGGNFAEIGGHAAEGLALNIQGAWFTGSSSLVGTNRSRCKVGAAGDIVVEASRLGSTAMGGLARRVGTTWQAAGLGLAYIPDDFAVLPDGSIAVCRQGDAVLASGPNGTWRSLTGGDVPNARHLTATLDGRLAAYGPSLTLWDGRRWTTIPHRSPTTVASTRAGHLLVAGFRDGPINPGRSIARFDGRQWIELDPTFSMVGNVDALVELADGSVVIARNGTTPPSLFRGSGGAWQLFAQLDGAVATMDVDGSGQLWVGGRFSTIQGLPANRLARWDGVAWYDAGQALRGSVASLAVTPSGDVWVSGDLLAPERTAARWETPCPAASATVGPGCAVGVDACRLSVSPWLLLGHRSTILATGLPDPSIAIVAVGLSGTNMPLTFTPGGLPDCVLWATPDLSAWTTAAGSAVFELALPDQIALLGGALHLQVVAFGTPAGGGPGAIGATPSRLLTIGSSH
jgi:hypothetical protein